jgi:LysR family transcriptional regulator, flagellar master operon regulator
MNLSTIQTFIAIAEAGQLNRAAERLHVTQSTVTTRLNSLEAELGQTLFLRRKSGTELTSAGFRFQRYAQLMVDTWRQARQETALPADIDATFNLGCHGDLWRGLGVDIFEYLHDHHPQVAISAWSGDQPELERWLGSGLIDAALSYAPVARENYTGYRLRDDRLVLVSNRPQAPLHPDPGYIYVDSGEEFRKNHAASYPDGDSPKVTLASSSWACDYLLKKGGSGYLPLRLTTDLLARGQLNRVVGAPEFTRSVYLVVNNNAAQNWPCLDAILTLGGHART